MYQQTHSVLQKSAKVGDMFNGILDPIKDFAESAKPYWKTGAVAAIPAAADMLFNSSKSDDRRGGGGGGGGGPSWLWLLPMLAMAGHWAYDRYSKDIKPAVERANKLMDAASPVVNEFAAQHAAWHGGAMPEGYDSKRMNQLRAEAKRLKTHKNSWFLHPADYTEYKMRSKLFGDPQKQTA